MKLRFNLVYLLYTVNVLIKLFIGWNAAKALDFLIEKWGGSQVTTKASRVIAPSRQ